MSNSVWTRLYNVRLKQQHQAGAWDESCNSHPMLANWAVASDPEVADHHLQLSTQARQFDAGRGGFFAG